MDGYGAAGLSPLLAVRKEGEPYQVPLCSHAVWLVHMPRPLCLPAEVKPLGVIQAGSHLQRAVKAYFH